MTSVPARGRHPRNLLTAGARRPLSVRGQTLLWIGVLTLAGAVLRFLRLGDQGLWYDESFTAMLVRHSPRAMLALIPRTEATPPLYYCLAWAWTRAFGRGAFGLRSLSACAGTALIPIGFGAASEVLRSRRAGIVCAALVAFDPLLWWYSQEARAYELLAALCGLSLWAFARALRDPARRELWLWALSSALALWTHYFAAVLILPEAVWLLLAHRRRRGVRIAVASLGACGLALVPLAIAQAARNHDAWIARSSLSLRAAQIIPQLLIGTGAPERALLKLVAFVCAGTALALLALAPPRVRRRAWIAGGPALAGAAVTVAPLTLGIDELLTRNLIELWLPLSVCAAAGLTLMRHRALRALGASAAIGLCAVGLAAILGVLGDPRLQRPDWPALVRALGDRPPAGEARLILVQRERGLMPLQVYLPGLHWLNRPARLSQVDVVAMRPVPGKLCWWGAECNLVASPLQGRYRLAGFAAVRRLRVAQFRVLELRAGRPTLLTRAELAHALTATELPHDGLLVQGRGSRSPRG